MIGEYFPEYIREKHHNPNFLGRFLREKSAAEKGSLSRVEGYYYDNENKVAVPTARDLIDRIDWSLIFDDIPTRPGHGESLCAFLRWLGVAVHTYFEDPNGKYAIVDDVSGLPSHFDGRKVRTDVFKKHPKLSDLRKHRTELGCRQLLQDRIIQDSQNICDRWDSYCEQICAEVCCREVPLIYFVDGDRGFGTQADVVLYISGGQLPEGVYVADFKISPGPITHSHRCQVEMQRRCVQQYLKAPVRGLVVRFDPFDEDYSMSISTNTDENWIADKYRETFDRKLAYSYDEEGVGIRLSQVAQDLS